MGISISEGARIVVREWLKVRPGESVTILSDELHVAEAMELRSQVEAAGASPVLVIVPSSSPQSGEGFDARSVAFMASDAIIGATHNSIMTTRAIHDAVRRGSRFLSLPLSTNDSRSLLEGDMMTMDTAEAARLARGLVLALDGGGRARVRTRAGTDLSLGIAGRSANAFFGLCDEAGVSTSASFEASISVVEDSSEGVLALDGSMGYIGLVDEGVSLRFEAGRLVHIEQNASGRRLAAYLGSFRDERMSVLGELGIGLNKHARCAGHSYIEDECSYGTFHVGLGRNIALGGRHYANGHFDLVAFAPDIEVDGRVVMRSGELI